MKIKNALFESGQYIETMGKIHQSRQLTVMDAYRINRLIKQVNELQAEYTTLKQGLLEKHGEKLPAEDGYDPNLPPTEQKAKGEMYRIEEGETREEFLKEMSELINLEHDLGIDKLAFPSKIDEDITVADMDILDIFFDFGFDTGAADNTTA